MNMSDLISTWIDGGLKPTPQTTLHRSSVSSQPLSTPTDRVHPRSVPAATERESRKGLQRPATELRPRRYWTRTRRRHWSTRYPGAFPHCTTSDGGAGNGQAEGSHCWSWQRDILNVVLEAMCIVGIVNMDEVLAKMIDLCKSSSCP